MLRRRARDGHVDRAGVGAGAIAALALLAAAALGGCGGDDTTTGYAPGVSRPIAKNRFIAEADRICASTNARVEAAGDDLVAGPTDPPPAEVRRVVLSVAVPALEAEVRAIRALGAPAGDEAQVEAIVAATEEGIEQVRADPVAVIDRGPPAAFRRAGRLARAYGSQECGLR